MTTYHGEITVDPVTGVPMAVCDICNKVVKLQGLGGHRHYSHGAGAKANKEDVATSSETVAEAVANITGEHKYRPMPGLLGLWTAVTKGARNGQHPANILFVGPSGSGKTEGAKFLAAKSGLDLVKVDAASMVDAESWFGQREVIAENGLAVTRYVPSAFVEALTRPCVILIDEMNRITDSQRQVLLPLLDSTHRVMNPLTGLVIEKHPECYILMSGNIGLQFTGTSAIDPAFMDRSLVVEFDYPEAADEVAIAMEATGVAEAVAQMFVRLAAESRNKAKADPDFNPISTREIISMSRLVANGLTPALAVKFAVLNSASNDGGGSSVRAQLETIWRGLAPAY